MSYGYDFYGRPIPPQQASQYPSQNPYRNELESLNAKMREMETRLFSNNQNYNAQPINTSNHVVNQPVSNQSTFFIPVSSANEAWEYPADWTGAEQYFRNKTDNEIYIKFFDANVPETVKLKGKLIKVSGAAKEEEPTQEVNNTNEIMEQLANLETEISEVKNMLANVTVLAPVAKSDSKPKRSSNGKFVAKEDNDDES